MAIKKPGEGGENKSGEGGENNEEKNYLTEEDLDAKLNATLTNYTKRLEKKVNDLLTPVMAKMDEVNGKLEASAKKSEEKSSEKGEELPPAVAAEIKRLQDAVAAERKAREDAENQRKSDAEKAKAEKASATLATALRDAGVTQSVQAKAAQALFESEGRVAFDDEDGELKLKVKDKYGEKLVPLGEGLADWIKSEEGTCFLPPRQAAGSGAVGNGRAPGKTPRDPKEARKAEALEVLDEAFGGG